MCHRGADGCVNPAHLTLEAPAINRGHTSRTYKTHCVNGHPLISENLMLHQGVRRCRICWRAAQKRHKTKNRADHDNIRYPGGVVPPGAPQPGLTQI
jgi:hypothetical protein